MPTNAWTSSFALLLALTALTAAPAKASGDPAPTVECMHEDIQAGVVPRVRDPGFALPQAPAGSGQPIRIHLDRSLLDRSSLSPSERDYVEGSAREAADWLESVLSVVPLVGSISHSGPCLSAASTDVTVTSADVLVLLSAEPIAGSTSAWAGFCQVDSFGRPVVGQLNVNPAQVDPATPYQRSDVDIMIHELTHLLGFSSSAFGSYREPLNGPVRGLANVRTSYAQNGKTVSAIITPTVVEAARAHFACASLIGAELEDGGGAGSAGSHWDQRIHDGELMAPTAIGNAGLARSVLTLALFADMGWYEVDLSAGEGLEFGHGEGCGFAEDRCDAWDASYFCTSAAGTACTPDGRSKAYCEIFDYGQALPAHFQYLTSPSQGGREVADFCPRYRAYGNGDCRDVGATPQQPLFGEVVGEQSGCFQSSLLAEGYVPVEVVRSTCNTMSCAGGVLSVTVDGVTKDCPTQGGVLTFAGYTGGLQCPAYDERCPTCGDGRITHDETCDDGNAQGGDGCSASCRIEPGASCSGFPSICSGGSAVVSALTPPMLAALLLAFGMAGVWMLREGGGRSGRARPS